MGKIVQMLRVAMQAQTPVEVVVVVLITTLIQKVETVVLELLFFVMKRSEFMSRQI